MPNPFHSKVAHPDYYQEMISNIILYLLNTYKVENTMYYLSCIYYNHNKIQLFNKEHYILHRKVK